MAAKKPSTSPLSPLSPMSPTPPKAAATDVATFLAELNHPLHAEIEALRGIILAAHIGLTEQVKWKAPSFCYQGDDRVTFQLQPARVQLIFHRGAKVKSSKGFVFVDETGLLHMITADRGVVTFSGMADIEARRAALTTLVARWIDATTVAVAG